MDVNETIAARVKALRTERGWSLDVLAECSGVSRSNISLIERGQSSPTAVVLDKLATALGVALASLFENAAREAESPPSPVARTAEQLVWKDPASGYVRRHLSPPAPSPLQLVEVRFPAGQRVSYDTTLQGAAVFQQVWMIRGEMEMTIGRDKWLLAKGDCLAMQLDCPVTFHNPSGATAHYLVALTSAPAFHTGSRS